MEKNFVFSQRKEMKKNSHAAVRGHYFVLIFLMLIMTVLGVEATLPTNIWDFLSNPTQEAGGGRFSVNEIMQPGDVLSEIRTGNLKQGAKKAKERSEQMIKDSRKSGAFGMTNGVLAKVVNSYGSGKLFSTLGQGLRTIIRSDRAVAALFVLGSMAWYLLIFTFVKNVYSAAARRVFLEARVYEKVSFLDITYFPSVKKWTHASWVMLYKYILKFLWDLTIIGGIIKRYSYFAVPYIVAENPTIGARKAVTLSRKMMNGHKFELFKYELTMIGWVILAFVTFGLSDLFYGAAYRMAAESEFYAKIRKKAIENGMEGTKELNDRYLFEKADLTLLYETYFDVVDEITVLHENKIELTGLRKVISDWLGVWIGSIEEKKRYDDQEGRRFALASNKASMQQKAYPNRLNPLWRTKEMEKQGNFSYLRNYTIWTLFLLFITFCFIGWSWEVALHFIQTGELVNRGTLHGPWLPIYGTGGIIVMLLCSRFRKNPVAEFFSAVILCGVLEYVSAWSLEMKYHQKWWSYDGYFLNLHGRICAEGLLVFGVGCCAIVYIFAPIFAHMLSKIKSSVLITIAAVLAVAYGTDYIYSQKHPNMAKGAIEEETSGETETETERRPEESGQEEIGSEKSDLVEKASEESSPEESDLKEKAPEESAPQEYDLEKWFDEMFEEGES